ncbi:MAG: Heimdall-CTERM domain-containing surface protein [Candidatus Hodarchaeales archaeon]|jgi:hypothetical protein
MKHKIKLLLSLFFIFNLIFLPISPVKAVDVGTDSSDDVGHITWSTTSIGLWDYSTTDSKPEIDIQKVTYEKNDTDGNVTIKVFMKGTPDISGNTFVYLIISDISMGLTVIAFAGGYETGFNPAEPGSVTVLVGINAASQILTDVVDGNAVVFNIPAEGAASDYYWPESPINTWNWTVQSWSGTDSQVQSGEWFMDYWPDTANLYEIASTNGDDNGDDGGIPGFELVPLFLCMVTLVVITFYHRRR